MRFIDECQWLRACMIDIGAPLKLEAVEA